MSLAILFALLMVYLLFCAVMCAIGASKQGDSAYSIMLFSIIVTYGGIGFNATPYVMLTHVTVYFFASILSFDPWHMITSFLPYLLLSPMYINVLNVYAFCNLDDVCFSSEALFCQAYSSLLS
jgi:chitin synthase